MSTPLTDRVEQVTQKEAMARIGRLVRESAQARNRAMAEFERRMRELWGVDIRAARLAPPTLTGGERDTRCVSSVKSTYVVKDGKLCEQLVRHPKNGQFAFIDQLTFVLDKKSFARLFEQQNEQVDDEGIVINAAFWLREIFGFTISHNREKSANFYSSSYNIGNHEISYGLVCIGGGLNQSNENTICIELTATGLQAALNGWEHRLYRFSQMQEVTGFRYTRVDLAVDFLSGEYTVDDALKAYYSGNFNNSIVPPRIRKEGDDWDNPTQNGRTLYIGTRESSRLLRFYEKGKQLGDKCSPWVRAELEMRNRDLIIPLDIVIHAGDYYFAQYPELGRIYQTIFSKQTEVSRKVQSNKIKQRIMQMNVEHVIKYLRQQASRAINYLIEEGKTDSQIIGLFDLNAPMPKKVHPGQYFAQLLNIDYISDKFSQPVCGYDGALPWPTHQTVT